MATKPVAKAAEWTFSVYLTTSLLKSLLALLPQPYLRFSVRGVEVCSVDTPDVVSLTYYLDFSKPVDADLVDADFSFLLSPTCRLDLLQSLRVHEAYSSRVHVAVANQQLEPVLLYRGNAVSWFSADAFGWRGEVQLAHDG